MKKIILITAAVFYSFSAYSDESLNTRIHNFYQSPRAMGMGNAYTSIADDYAAIFYNPSMLSFRKNSEFQINLVSAALATKTLSLSKEVSDASKTGATDNEKATAVSDVLENYYGKPLGARVSPLEFIWVSPNWGLSLVVADVTIDALVQRQLGPVLDIYAIKDTSLSYAYSHLLNSDMSLGATARFNHRSELQGVYSALDLALDSNVVDFKKSGEGTNLDFDLAFTWKPDFNAVPAATEKITKNHKKGKARVARMIAQEKAADKAADKAAEKVDEKDVVPVTEKKVEKEADKKEISTTSNQAGVKVQAEVKTKDEALAPADKTAEASKKEPVVEDSKKAEIVKDVPQEADTKTDGIQINTKKINDQKILAPHQPLTMTAVVRNVLSLDYTKSNKVNKDSLVAPQKNNRTVDLGVSYALFENSFSSFKVAGEAKNLLHKSATLNKCAHLGLEFTLAPADWFVTQYRAGMNQMYFTAGFGLQLSLLNLEFVTYGEEFGTADNKVENRVNALTVAFKF